MVLFHIYMNILCQRFFYLLSCWCNKFFQILLRIYLHAFICNRCLKIFAKKNQQIEFLPEQKKNIRKKIQLSPPRQPLQKTTFQGLIPSFVF